MTLELPSLRSSWYEVCNGPLRFNFQLIEVTYHNYDEGGPEKPDCDTVTKNEEGRNCVGGGRREGGSERREEQGRAVEYNLI